MATKHNIPQATMDAIADPDPSICYPAALGLIRFAMEFDQYTDAERLGLVRDVLGLLDDRDQS